MDTVKGNKTIFGDYVADVFKKSVNMDVVHL